MMKKYDIMLEYDVHVSVEVEAENEESAFKLAAGKASTLSPEEFFNRAEIGLNTDYFEAHETHDQR